MIDPATFWGKASSEDGATPIFHPLVFHALDVAACFEALLDVDRRAAAALEAVFAAPIARVARALAALVALHDIGKVDWRFQAKSEAAWPPMLGKWKAAPVYDHGAGSYALLLGHLKRLVAPLLDADQNQAEKKAILWPIAFHHGKPCDRMKPCDYAHAISTKIDPPAAANARLVAESIFDAFGEPIAPLPFFGECAAKRVSWLLSGLVSLADWIGSSTRYFPYRAPDFATPRDYLAYARQQARKAIAQLRLAPTPPAEAATFASLFSADWTPSAAQAHCADLSFADGPTLVIIEDITGSGKTEAALLLAQRMMRAGKGRGVFVALPTMATANAMFARMAECYRGLFAPDQKPSLALAHGRARPHEGFRASIFPDDGVGEEGVPAEIETVHGGCSAFFASDRRKALLADVGVATIDQALLAVLPTKYATLRQYGLSGKILIVDEAHAYDAYMSRELERLLTFHAGFGGSAIILSATLPRRMKEAYARAFRGGTRDDEIRLEESAYPLVTSLSMRGDAAEAPLAPRKDLRREVKTTRLANPEEALARIAKAAAAGAAVAYIRNSVDDAVEACEALRAMGVEPILFHARFAMCDRARIEDHVLATFGKGSTAQERKGAVLVATQVVEQSLDLDFDLIVSDLAPIDLLIQRAGRLWRHERGARPLKEPQFLVVSPEPTEDAGADWFAKPFRRAAYVYQAHAILWLTARTLFDAGAIRSPDGVRPMIETVYGEDLNDRVPEGLRDNLGRADGERHAKRSGADLNLLVYDNGYTADHRGWSDDVNTPTRLGEAQTTFRLAFWRDGALRPYARDDDEARAWALSEVSIRASAASARGACPPEIERAAAAGEEVWRRHGDRAVILPFADEIAMQAAVRNGKGKETRVIYNATVGLRLSKLS